MANRLVQIQGFNSCSNIDVSNLSNVVYNYSTPTYTEGTDISNLEDGEYVIDLPTLKIYRSGNSLIAKGVNGTNLGMASFLPATVPDCDFQGLAFAVSDDNQTGSIISCYHINYGGYYANFTSFTNYEYITVYQAIIGAEVVPYTWESVPRITGKEGKVYRLTDILNINDGLPVNDVSAKNNVDFSKKTKVNTLINDVIPVVENPTKAIVKYSMPIANYEYVKLVYKAGAIPTSVEDGTVKNIDADDNDVSVTGLEEQKTYYFVIFTDKTTSDAEAFRTGAIPIPEGKWVETISTCKATDDNFSMQFTEETESWKINRSGSNEWVWLRNLGDYTLTTSSKTPDEVFANSNVLTYDTLNAGSNPIRTLQNDATWFEKRWDLDNNNYFKASQYSQSGTGINANAQLQFGGGGSVMGLSVSVYGVDLLIAVNHATMESRMIWIAYLNNTGSNMNRTVQGSAQSNGYMSLSKFM